MKAYLKDILITEGIVFPLEATQNSIHVSFHRCPDDYYTILMVDPDAPSRANPIYKYWLHFLAINNHDKQVKYEPPTPPAGSGPHRYFIYLLKQQSKLPEQHIAQRPNFDLDRFIAQNKLEIVDCTYFITENKAPQ